VQLLLRRRRPRPTDSFHLERRRRRRQRCNAAAAGHASCEASGMTDLYDLIATLEDDELRTLGELWLLTLLLRDLDLERAMAGAPAA
jgi:hypothetical protein